MKQTGLTIITIALFLLGSTLIIRGYLDKKNPNSSLLPLEPSQVPSLTRDAELEAAIKRVEKKTPREIQGIPPEFQFTLEREKCFIVKGNQGFLITGSFSHQGQTDTAALCLTEQGELTIKIAWGGSKRPCPVSLAYGNAQKYLYVNQQAEFELRRQLQKTPRSQLRQLLLSKGIQQPQTVDGLKDIWSTSASTRRSKIYYCDGKAWQALE